MQTIKRFGAFLAVGLLLLALVPVAHADLSAAMHYYKSGKYLEAAGEFQSLVDQSPDYAYGHFMIGTSMLKMGKPGDAEQNLLKALDLNGDRFEYHLALANSYFFQRQYAKSIATLKTAEALATDANTQFYLYKRRGMSYAELEKWADAIDDLEKAKGVKKTPGILDRLGQAYYELRHYDKAVPALREALQQTPGSVSLVVRLATSLLNMGAEATSDSQKRSYYRDAVGAAKQYQDMKPNDAEANNLVGRASLGAKEFNAAEQAFKKVLALKPDHCFAMTNLGKTYIALQRWADAESSLHDATQCAPRLLVAYENLGFAMQKQKKLEEAIEVYERALELKTTSSIQKAISVCEENIKIRDENKAMDVLKTQQEEAQRIADEKYEAELRKTKEWEKARDDN